MSQAAPSVSVFFPAYNDSESIAPLVRGAARILRERGADFEVVVVNDGSRDDTGAVLEALRAEIPQLSVVHHLRNRGYGAALISGLYSCTREWIFYTDGDGQYDVEEMTLLLDRIAPGVDVVNGYKIARSDPFYRILLGKVYLAGIHFAFALKTRDVDCDYRLMRRSMFDHIRLACDSGVICVELVKKIEHNGYNIVEVPVHHYPRQHGHSEFFRLRHLSRVCLQLTTLWFRLMVLRRLDERSPVMEKSARPGQ